MAQVLKREAQNHAAFDEKEKQLQVVMSILSNYVNNCIVRTSVSCPIEDLKTKDVENPFEYAEKFVTAVNIAKIEPYRAVTHNKGIMNGIDAVVLATGNDFRAVEAGAHAYASRDGQYRSLSKAEIKNNVFTFSMDIPLALGTVGGLTSLHPMVKIALQILKNPSAKRLMSIVASAGLAQNFAALNSLTTKGIQEGHMKMHLNNILNQYQATNNERIEVQNYFANNTITHASVSEFIKSLRA
jgi:hydroxymethylglutaryl-CoA reductase